MSRIGRVALQVSNIVAPARFFHDDTDSPGAGEEKARRHRDGVDPSMIFFTSVLPMCLRGLLLGLSLALGAAAPAARAARPMITDDARLIDAKACQVESWVRRNQASTEYWALPACNVTGNLELTFGGARTSDDTGIQTSDVILQGKTLFKRLEPNGWSWGLAFGNAGHPAAHRRRIGDLYSYVPASFSFRDDLIVLHTNVGWLHDRGNKRHRMTWGVGSETRLAERTWLIAETFGQNQGKPFYQIGLRHWLVPNHVQIDTTFGERAGNGSGERWISIGLRLLSNPFLP